MAVSALMQKFFFQLLHLAVLLFYREQFTLYLFIQKLDGFFLCRSDIKIIGKRTDQEIFLLSN